MTTVVIGTNSFSGWDALLGMDDQVLFSVDATMQVTFSTPRVPGYTGPALNVSSAGVEGEITVKRADAKSVALLWSGHVIVLAVQFDPDTVHVHLDLRPIGMAVYDDAASLHVGNMQFAFSSFAGSGGTAIRLG